MPAETPRPVDVLHEGRWVRGTLLVAYRSGSAGRWRGVVRYAVAPGEQYQQARWAEELRAAEEQLLEVVEE